MFITLEGPEGSGKSSQLPLLADWLRQQDYQVFTTREPGGTFIGDQIRSVLGNLENTAMQPRTEILLFLAARAQLVEEVMRPMLEKGTIIICDRYADSTLAYQGYGHGVDLVTLKKLLDFATGGLYPDLILYLDIDVQAGLDRRKKSGGEWNRLDAYALAFHRRVRQGYLTMADADPDRWIKIDASGSFKEVQQAMQKALADKLPLFVKTIRKETT